MNNMRGFISLPVLTLIILVLGLGSVGYIILQQRSDLLINSAKDATDISQKATENKQKEGSDQPVPPQNTLTSIDDLVFKNAGGVYVIDNESGESYKIPEADPETFIFDEKAKLYRDKNYAYIRRASEDGDYLIVIKGVDPASFALLSYLYSKDKNGVYFMRPKWLSIGQPVLMPFADKDTFGVDPTNSSLAKDKNYVYWLGEDTNYDGNDPRVAGADPATFVSITNSPLFKDKNHVYSPFDFDTHQQIPMVVIPDVKPATYRSFGPTPGTETRPAYGRVNAYGTDGQSVFYYNHRIEGADPVSFQVFKPYTATYPAYDAKDKNYWYRQGKISPEQMI